MNFKSIQKILLTLVIVLSFMSYENKIYYEYYSVFQIIITVVLTLLITITLRYDNDIKKQIFTDMKKFLKITVLFSLMILNSCVATVLYSYSNLVDVFKIIIMFFTALMLFIIVPEILLKDEKLYKYFINLILIICVISSVISVIINIKGTFLSYTSEWERVSSIYFDPNFFGMILGIGFFCVFMSDSKKITKIFTMVLLLYATLLTGSRGTIISIMLVAILGIIFFSKMRTSRKILIMIGMTAVGIIAMKYLLDIGFFRIGQGSNGRMDMIMNIINEAYPKSPVFGYGYSSIKTYLIEKGFNNVSTHNSFVDFLFAYGTIPTLIYILFIIKIIIKSMKLKTDPNLTTLVCFLILNMNTILYSFGGTGVGSLLFTIFLGMLNYMEEMYAKKQETIYNSTSV